MTSDYTKSQAEDAFSSARRKAFLEQILSMLSGRSNRLLSWDEVRTKLGVRGQIDRGMQSVPVTKIIGSVGRYKDFSRAFLPTQSNTASRWRSIASAYFDEVSLPPVKLYKIGDAYFVLDGNHRVSVAREEGMAFIDAEVIEADSRVPVTADLDADDLGIKGEYARFLEHTHLDELRPDQNIVFTIGGGYDRLLEHIAVHRYFMGLERHGFVSEDDAVCEWYDTLYLPMVRVIRVEGVLAEFPGRTEADLYLWTMDHQHYLRERYGQDVGMDKAAKHFADHYTPRLFKRLANMVQELLAGKGEAEELGVESSKE